MYTRLYPNSTIRLFFKRFLFLVYVCGFGNNALFRFVIFLFLCFFTTYDSVFSIYFSSKYSIDLKRSFFFYMSNGYCTRLLQRYRYDTALFSRAYRKTKVIYFIYLKSTCLTRAQWLAKRKEMPVFRFSLVVYNVSTQISE